MNDETRRELEAARRRPVPAPDEAFADALKQRLIAIAGEPRPAGRGVTDPGSRPTPRRPRWSFGVVAAAFAVVLAVGLAVGLGVLDDPDRYAYELTDTVNVEVALVDGTTLVDPQGLVLPDAVVVTVGPGGSARIGEVVLGAGDVATVKDGRLRIDRGPGVGSVAPTPSATSTQQRPSGRPGTPAPTTTPDASTKPTPTASTRPSAGEGTPRPDASLSPRPSPTTTPVPPVKTPGPTPTATAPAPADVKPIRLLARFTAPAVVRVAWTATPGARRYVLVARSARLGPIADPVYPGATVIGEFTHPPVTPLEFRVRPDVSQIRLLVVVLAADGTELTRSNVATARPPG